MTTTVHRFRRHSGEGERSRTATPPLRSAGTEPAAFLVLVDIVCLVIAFIVAYTSTPRLKSQLLNSPAAVGEWLLLLGPQFGGEYRPLSEVAWVLLVMSVVALLFIQTVGGYRPLVRQSRAQLVLTGLGAPLAGLSTITVTLFALSSAKWSRLFLFLFTALSATALCAVRLLLRWYRTKRVASGFHARSVMLVGPTRAVGWLSSHFDENISRAEYDVVGYLRIAPSQLPVVREAPEGPILLPCLGDVSQLSALMVHRPVHEVIAVQGGTSEWLRELVETCDYFRVTLRIVPEVLVFGELRDLQLIYHSDPLRLPEIVLRPRHLDSTALFFKRLLDIAGSATLLVLLSPLFALIALAIKVTTPGLAVFYRWNVVGYNGRGFTGFKFSTMVENAEARRTSLQSLNEMQGPVFKIRNDPRVTPLGRLLRKFSLNELPQLWSVLKGDMSLVGPRPAFPHELERYELWHKRKLTVRPGMTCLWQVRGRNKISNFDDWVRLDLEYIDQWSLWLDVKILFRTAWVVVAGTGS